MISAEGVAKATTRRIAEEAGVSGAIVHYAFATKDDLLQAVYESLTASASGEIGRHTQRTMGLEVGIDRGFEGSSLRNDQNAVPALLELTAWLLRNPPSRHLAPRVYRRHIDLTAGLVAQAAPDTPPGILDLVARLINMICLQWRAVGDDSLDRLTPKAVEMVQEHVRQSVA